ncbi:Sec1p [Sugiyamaella lignohabitans]|uniref:Sec1p n=1 Tax=Sugiyamaella lignohabitans TaxID=796027 RepID=A0A167CNB5_9ASCO|nr:Sec1p [Sugiyamaella lignohabitans]ANB11915.1 Sec1p [Sugiyamaella lignohabitans]
MLFDCSVKSNPITTAEANEIIEIFGLLDSVNPASRYKAVILDRETKKNFDRVIEVHEILDRNASSVQILDEKRQSESYLEAVYFIKPTAYNIECIAADFTRAPTRYACAHIFVTSNISDELLVKLKNSATGRYLKRLEIVHIDFWTLESQVFTLDDPFAIEQYYSSQCHDLVTKLVKKVASQLVGVCVMLDEYPIIRFYKPTSAIHEAHVLPFMIADEFQKQMDDYLRNNPNFKGVSEQRGRSVFLILDRSIDPFAPFLHEFTFQAMAYDLLPVKDGLKVEYFVDGKTGKEKVEGVISEKDPDWVGLRHLHMQEVIEKLTEKMDRLKTDNPHFAASQIGNGNSGGNTTVSDLQDMVASLPAFMETKDRFALNLHMASECMEILQRKGLSDIADVEQTVTLGVGADGIKPKNLADEFIALIADPNLGKAEKVRLVMLYSLHRGGLIEADYKKLMHHSGLDDTDIDVIRNMTVFGHPTFKTTLGKLKQSKLPKSYFSHSTEDVYSVSRFVPGVKNVVASAIERTLSADEFPYTKYEPTEGHDEMEVQASLRNPRQRAVWAKTTATSLNKQRVFVYMAGGFTQSEARSIYELNKKYPKEIIIGGDQVITPNNFLRILSRLSVSRKQLNLPCDQPKQQVPQHLFESDRQNRPSANQATPASTPAGQQASRPSSSKASSSTTQPERPPIKEKKSRFGKFFK